MPANSSCATAMPAGTWWGDTPAAAGTTPSTSSSSTSAGLTSLTSGTLVVDTSPDRRTFYVHCMYARDYDELITQLSDLKRRLVSEGF